MISYLDSSAAMKLVVEERESQALAEFLGQGDRYLVGSWLLHTEMHCAVGRYHGEVSADVVNQVLAAITLADVTRGDLLAAGTHAPLRSLDAIHLAAALRLEADELITYDHELAEVARHIGVQVQTPA